MNPTLRDQARNSRIPRHQAGLTLLEMLISITLGLLLVFGIGTIFVGSNQTYRVQEENARIQEAGRYILELIGRNVRQAGGQGPINSNPITNTLNCLPPACTAVSGTNGAGSDTLAIEQYANFDENNAGTWGSRDCTGGFAAATPAPTLITNTFAVNGTNLNCTGSVGGAQPLFSEIEDFEVLYGIDITGDQSADRYVDTPPGTPPNWNQVVSVRVCVLVRSPNVGVVAGNQRFLTCAGALGTEDASVAAFNNPARSLAYQNAPDTRLRRAFVATFNLRNRVNNLP